VAVVYEDFVVVVAMGLTQHGSLKANLVTCYQAADSLRGFSGRNLDRFNAGRR